MTDAAADTGLSQRKYQDQIRISVVIPYFNAHRTIERAVLSVCKQSLRPSDVIIVDDGSEIPIQEWQHKLDELCNAADIVLQVIRKEKNCGPSAARNQGWDRSTADVIAFLDADDEWHPSKLEICARVLEAKRCVAVYHCDQRLSRELPPGDTSGLRNVDEFTVSEVPTWKWLLRNQAVTPAVVVKRSLPERFDSATRYCEDHDLWIRISDRCGPFIAIQGPSLVRLGRTPMTKGGLSGQRLRMRIGEMRMFWKFCTFRSERFLLLLPLFGLSIVKHAVGVARLLPFHHSETNGG